MKLFLSNILLAGAWMLLTGQVNEVGFGGGFLLGYLVLRLAFNGHSQTSYFIKVRQVAGFALYFIMELFKATARVALDVVTPRHRMRPGIIALPLDAETDMEIMLLGNLITLTPGTLSLSVSDDRKTLYVHTMYVDDVEKFRHELKHGLERRLLEVMR